MAKEKNFNPVQAQRKADKAKALKKGKAEVTLKRNERLAKRNPERIQQQVSDLKAITDGGGKLTRHEEQVLEGLEKELKAVNKAREQLGEKAPTFGRPGGHHRDGDRGGSSLGKRRRDDREGSTDSEDEAVPEDVRSIPMPRDTPPPIPKEVLDQWYAKRRAKRQGNANLEPLGRGREDMQRRAAGGDAEQEQDDGGAKRRSAPPPVQAESRTVYEAKPQIRDLRKEAVSAFVPAAVRTKLEKGRGQGGLIEPEEADRLEKEGYLKQKSAAGTADASAEHETALRHVTMEEVDDEEG